MMRKSPPRPRLTAWGSCGNFQYTEYICEDEAQMATYTAELPLVAQSLACYEEAKRNVSGAAEVSTVSVYWANRTK